MKTAEEREREFREEFQNLLKKHDAGIQTRCLSSECDSIAVFMLAQFDRENKLTKEHAYFRIKC